MGSQTPSMRVTGWSNGQPLPTGAGMACGSLTMMATTISIMAGMRWSWASAREKRSPCRCHGHPGGPVRSFEALPSGGGYSAITPHPGCGGCLRHWRYAMYPATASNSARHSDPLSGGVQAGCHAAASAQVRAEETGPVGVRADSQPIPPSTTASCSWQKSACPSAICPRWCRACAADSAAID